MDILEVKNPELLSVEGEDGNLATGGDQHWYPKEGFIPPGACGATTASNVLAYLLRSRPGLFSLARQAGLTGLAEPFPGAKHSKSDYNFEVGGMPEPNTKAGYIGFMKQVYRFFYPRVGGLMADQFLDGAGDLAKEYKLPLAAECLRVPIARQRRPSFADAAAFIGASLEADIPLAFLILSGGSVASLDTWHWVTVLALDEGTKLIKVLDNTAVFQADLGVWLGTSIMGGAFVRFTEI